MENFELINVDIDRQGEQVISGRELHEFLEIKTKYVDWFNRMLKYGFEENTDYLLLTQKRETNNPKNPTTEITDHILKLDMAKELCMIQRTPLGRQARQYFINIEKAYKHFVIARELGKEARKTLTDVIKEQLPDTLHKKFMYKNFTDLVYKSMLGVNTKELKDNLGLDKKDNLRDYLSGEQLERIQDGEEVVKSLLKLGRTYKEIKDILQPRPLITAE